MNKILELLNDARLEPTSTIKEDERRADYASYLSQDKEQSHLSLAALAIISEQLEQKHTGKTSIENEVGWVIRSTIMDKPPTLTSFLTKVKRVKKEGLTQGSLAFLTEAITEQHSLSSLVNKLNNYTKPLI